MNEELNALDGVNYLEVAAETSRAARKAFERERDNMSDEEIALFRAHLLALKEDVAELKAQLGIED